VRSVRRECLDWLLIVSRKHLERVLREYVLHYNAHRPHRALEQRPPLGKPPRPRSTVPTELRVRRRDRLGGLLHESSAPRNRATRRRHRRRRLVNRSP
jgi:putative transposase